LLSPQTHAKTLYKCNHNLARPCDLAFAASRAEIWGNSSITDTQYVPLTTRRRPALNDRAKDGSDQRAAETRAMNGGVRAFRTVQERNQPEKHERSQCS